VHIFDVSLKEKQVWFRLPIHFQRTAVVPFDRALNLFAIQQYDNHGRMRIDLFFIVEEFGICFHRWRRPLAHLDCCLLCSSSGLSSSISTTISSALAARPTMGTAIRALPHLRNFPGLAFDLGERGPDQFTIAHFFLPPKI